MGFFCHFYITANVLELSEMFPEKKSLMIGLTNSLFDASGIIFFINNKNLWPHNFYIQGGLFLVFKMLYDPPLSFTLKGILIVYAAFTIIIWVNTLFLAPEKSYLDLQYLSSFQERFDFKNWKLTEII